MMDKISSLLDPFAQQKNTSKHFQMTLTLVLH
jgi:hypothetical protein